MDATHTWRRALDPFAPFVALPARALASAGAGPRRVAPNPRQELNPALA